jgi:hypothetical protein
VKRSSPLLTSAVPCSILLALTAASPAILAQPDRVINRPDSGLIAPGDGEHMGDPAERLRRRLADLDAERTRLEVALNRLEAGEPWDEVRADLLEPNGPGIENRPERQEGQGAPRPRGQTASRLDEPRLLEMLTRVDPEAAERFAQMRDRNPRLARRLLQNSAPKLQQLAMLEEADPALYEVQAEEFRLERQIMHTAMSLHAAIAGVEAPGPDNASIDQTRQRLRELVGRQVDLQIQGQRIKLASAKERLDELGASIETRVGTRESVIDDRVDRIMERAVRSGVNRRHLGDRIGRDDRNDREGHGDDSPPPRQRRNRPE